MQVEPPLPIAQAWDGAAGRLYARHDVLFSSRKVALILAGHFSSFEGDDTDWVSDVEEGFSLSSAGAGEALSSGGGPSRAS